jgi:hypothetical protein
MRWQEIRRRLSPEKEGEIKHRVKSESRGFFERWWREWRERRDKATQAEAELLPSSPGYRDWLHDIKPLVDHAYECLKCGRISSLAFQTGWCEECTVKMRETMGERKMSTED